MTDNCERQIKSEIESNAHDATKALQHFLKVSKDFETTKKYLNTTGNYYINYLFSLLGYQYKGTVEHLNILHLSTQAWLLGALAELRKEIKSENIKLTYSQLLTKLKEIIVEENDFIDNMNLLTGVYGLKEGAFEDDRIFKMFLVNIQETKNHILIQINENLSKKDFEEILQRNFRIAFNYLLNEFNSEEEDKKSLDMLNIYIELTNNKEKTANLENYVKLFFDRKSIKSGSTLTEEQERKLILHLDHYYNFLQSNLENMTEEINLFNYYSVSILHKLKNLLSIKNLRRLYIKYFDILVNSVEFGLRNLRLEGVINFTKNLYEGVKPLQDKTTQLVQRNYTACKSWINQTAEKSYDFCEVYLKTVSKYTNSFYTASLKYTEIPRRMVFENVYAPLSNLTINVKDTSVNVIIHTYNMSKNTTIKVKDLVVTKLSNLKTNIFGEEPILKIEYEGEDKDYINVSISKKIILLNPIRAKEIINDIIESVRQFNLKEVGINTFNYTKDKFNIARNFLHNSYRSFLELANEEELEDDLVIKSFNTKESKLKNE